MDLYLSEAISIAIVKERGSKLEARKAELTEFLATAEAPPPLLHPQMAEFYHRQLARLHDMLHSELDEKRQEAAEVIRSLIEPSFSHHPTRASRLMSGAIWPAS